MRQLKVVGAEQVTRRRHVHRVEDRGVERDRRSRRQHGLGCEGLAEGREDHGHVAVDGRRHTRVGTPAIVHTLHDQDARALAASAAIALSLCTPAAAQIDARMFRYPDVSATHIAFVYAGDIWVVPKDGGMATRLTSAPGEELFPRFSPDGSHIAFSASYDGNLDAYVVPTLGGDPVRLDVSPDGRPRRGLAPGRHARADRVEPRVWAPAVQPVLPGEHERRAAREAAGALRRVRLVLA